MTITLPSVERVVSLLSRFPGIGRKSGWRMIHYLLRQGPEGTEQLIEALIALRDKVRRCSCCFNLAEGELCWICQDPGRDPRVICVVEEAGDLLAIERSGIFRGSYHVLGGRLSPLDNIGPRELHLESLMDRLRSGAFTELIMATNPTVQGEATAHYVVQLATPLIPKITRLAYGLPMGGELEYLDESTLYQAMHGRRNY